MNNQNRAAQMKRLVESKKEVQAKVEIARERLQERPIDDKQLKGADIRSRLIEENNPPPKTDIELNDKWAMIFGFDAPPKLDENPQFIANRVKTYGLLPPDKEENNKYNFPLCIVVGNIPPPILYII
jgi:hypothetical protein